MKTAISIPDDLFDAADQLAHGMGISRSQLYSRAVESYVKENNRQMITEAIDRVLAETTSELDPLWVSAQARALDKTW